MSIEKANALFRENELEDALEAYKKINKEHPLYEQAQFNIQLVNKRLNRSKDLLNFKNSQVAKSSPTKTLNGPLVSVVMPVFNVAPYLDASIMSVLNQTYENIELIIVDDASTDNGMNIIKMYEKQDSRIKVISLEFNTLGGAGIPSNIGVDNAKGEYIAYADSDDILDKHAIEKMITAALEHNVEVVIADFCNFSDETRVVEVAYDKNRWGGLPLDKSFSPIKYPDVFKLSPVPWRKLYSRNFLDLHNIRFPEGDYFYEDNPLHWFVLSKANSVFMLDYVVAFHRMGREGQTMGADSFKLAAHFCHSNTVAQFFKRSEMPISDFFWKELLRRSTGYNWLIRQAKDVAVQDTLKKRNSQLISHIVESSNISKEVIERDIPETFVQIHEYSKARSDVDLTIIIPVYNCADLLESTLQSLTQFKKINIEVLLMNDGSSDDSLMICQKYAEQFDNFYIFTQNNKGAGVARNAVIPLAIGEYTYFLDADDTIEIENLEEAVLQARNNSNDLLLFKYKIDYFDKNKSREMFNSDQKIWNKLLVSSDNNDKKVLASGLINYPWNRIIATKLLHDENIFFGKTVVHNDVPYHWHSIMASENIGILDEVVCHHRKFDEREQITNIKDSRRLMVLEAYRHTHHLISKYKGFDQLLPVWKDFITHLLTWAEDKIPDADKSYYNAKRIDILSELNHLCSNSDEIEIGNIDTEVGFYRIIGNSISGLHAENQAEENLEYILNNESSVQNVTKYFVLNRIFDDSHRHRLLKILKDKHANYLEIAFDPDVFKKIGYDFGSLPDSYYWFAKKGRWADIVSNTAVRNFKNAYLMNNNGARNFALQHGKSRFDWIMPWDGNCFLPDDSFKKLLSSMAIKNGSYKYVATPMQRVTSEDYIDRDAIVTNAIDEPQISFRRDAKEVFNEDRVYGNQSKVELFKRLGYKNDSWDKLINLYPWRKLKFVLSSEQGQLIEASGVFRLYSGNNQAATNGENRSHTRSFGIIETIDKVEADQIAATITMKANRIQPLLATKITTLAPKNKLEKLFENNFSNKTDAINKLNSKDRVYAVVYAFSQSKLLAVHVASVNIERLYFKEDIDLANVDKFCAVLNNLTTALVCSLISKDYVKAVKIKLDLAMLLYYYHFNMHDLNFKSSRHAKHIEQIIAIVTDIFDEVFEYSFHENFKHTFQ